jgi:hypothetical protein
MIPTVVFLHGVPATRRSIRQGLPGWVPVTSLEDMVMLEALVLIGLVVCGLTVLDVIAARLGVDSHRAEHVDWTSPEPILWL